VVEKKKGNMKYKQYIYGLLLTVALSACNEYGDLENVMVSRESIRQIFIPALAVTPNTTELEAKGGSLTLTVTSNTAWTVEVPAWCSCSPSVGEGNGVVTINATENQETTERTGQVTITANGVTPQSFTIRQKGRSDIPSSGDNLPPE
jgi:hypothetical protein